MISSTIKKAASAFSGASEFAKKTAEAALSTPQEKRAPATYSEEGVADMVGISVEDVRALRTSILYIGAGYLREGNDPIRITEEGLDSIIHALGEKKSAAMEQRTYLLIVDTSRLPNPKIILAKAPGSSTLLRVRVKDSSNWTRGMVLNPCRRVDGTLYAYEGRQPRARGKM